MKHSAGIILCRKRSEVEVLLVHPGGPFWANKDGHAWSIPKGEFDPSTEDALAAAEREFAEELGHPVPNGPRTPLPTVRASGKTIHAWLVAGDLDPATIVSNLVEIEWPPRSGKFKTIPEVDRAQWFPLPSITSKLHKGQAPFAIHIGAALNTSD